MKKSKQRHRSKRNFLKTYTSFRLHNTDIENKVIQSSQDADAIEFRATQSDDNFVRDAILRRVSHYGDERILREVRRTKFRLA